MEKLRTAARDNVMMTNHWKRFTFYHFTLFIHLGAWKQGSNLINSAKVPFPITSDATTIPANGMIGIIPYPIVSTYFPKTAAKTAKNGLMFPFFTHGVM